MCARHVLEVDAQGLLQSYAPHSAKMFDWDAVSSVAPRTKAPVIREHIDDESELQRTVEFAHCGFKPAWAKEKGPRPIYARFETAHTNGMFRAGFTSSRAVVSMSDYFKRVEMDDGKQPYYVHTSSRQQLHAAGLTTAERNNEGGWDISFTIVTREAKDAAGNVHNRMPALLDDGLMAERLPPEKLEKDEREHLHSALSQVSEMIAASPETYPADRAVDKARTLNRGNSSLIAPI